MKSFLRNYTFVDYATQAYLIFVGVLIAVFHNATVPSWRLRLGLHLGALVLVHLLICWHKSRPANVIIRFLRHFYPVLFYVWFFTETGVLNRMFVSDYLDTLVIHSDQWLFGAQPSILFMERFPYLLVSEMFYASYFSYYLMISGIGIALYLKSREQFFHYVSIVSFVFFVCYTIYIFLPVIGPRVFFQDIAGYSLPEAVQKFAPDPGYPPALRGGLFFNLMAWVYRTFEAAPGAAMPSSHVAIAITTLFFSFRYLPKIRYIHLVMVLLLCSSTVYCRYHYVVDVIAGCLTALVLIPTGNALYFRLLKVLPATAEPEELCMCARSDG